MYPISVLFFLVLIFFFSGIRIVYQYKRAVKFRFGRFISVLEPGFRWIIPIVETVQLIDIRVITINITTQEIMTRDNVPSKINGVLFFEIKDAKRAVIEVADYEFAISQLAQAALRDVCGKVELDTILSRRDEMGENIREMVASEIKNWGIVVLDVKIKDIELPENMKRSMANQAEAERSRRARIILAEAEQQAAQKLVEAGKLIDQSPSAIKLRLYQTLADIASEKNSTIVFPFPEEILHKKN